MAEQDSTSAEHEGEVPINWEQPGNIPTQYATNMVIQSLGQEFLLSFYEVRPPIITGSLEEHTAEFAQGIPAKCGGRIIVSPGRLQQFSALLQKHLEHLLANQELVEET
jgi:hypothetical protein